MHPFFVEVSLAGVCESVVLGWAWSMPSTLLVFPDSLLLRCAVRTREFFIFFIISAVVFTPDCCLAGIGDDS